MEGFWDKGAWGVACENMVKHFFSDEGACGLGCELKEGACLGVHEQSSSYVPQRPSVD